VAMSGAVYVNASWLVAMSALEPAQGRAAPPAPVASGQASAMPAVPASPRAAASLAECVSAMRLLCACADTAQCAHEPTDKSFETGQEECAWVKKNESNATTLCVLSLMSRSPIRRCVQKPASLCGKPTGSREDAKAFVADATCVDTINACLTYGEPTAPVAETSGCSGCSYTACNECNENVTNCNRSCAQCNQNCSQCSQNCSQCNQNCSQCNSMTEQCNSACKSNRCSVPREDPPGEPAGGALLFLLSPAVFVLRRARSRA
jgi:hypothetical protein